MASAQRIRDFFDQPAVQLQEQPVAVLPAKQDNLSPQRVFKRPEAQFEPYDLLLRSVDRSPPPAPAPAALQHDWHSVTQLPGPSARQLLEHTARAMAEIVNQPTQMPPLHMRLNHRPSLLQPMMMGGAHHPSLFSDIRRPPGLGGLYGAHLRPHPVLPSSSAVYLGVPLGSSVCPPKPQPQLFDLSKRVDEREVREQLCNILDKKIQGFSLRVLANMTGFSRSAISLWRRDKYRGNNTLVSRAVCHALQVLAADNFCYSPAKHDGSSVLRKRIPTRHQPNSQPML